MILLLHYPECMLFPLLQSEVTIFHLLSFQHVSMSLARVHLSQSLFDTCLYFNYEPKNCCQM